MNITFKELNVNISWEEASTLYSTLKHSIRDRIMDHWKNHPDAFEKMEQCRFHMMRELARFTGNDFLGDAAELKKFLDEKALEQRKLEQRNQV